MTGSSPVFLVDHALFTITMLTRQEEPALANGDEISITTCHLTEKGALCSAAALVHYARLAKFWGQSYVTFTARQGKPMD